MNIAVPGTLGSGTKQCPDRRWHVSCQVDKVQNIGIRQTCQFSFGCCRPRSPHPEQDLGQTAPSGNFAGVQIWELRYDTAFGVQSRILSSLCYHGNRLFNFPFPHYWSPHSGRNFLPTAASVLGISTQEKNCWEVGRHVAANSTTAWPRTKIAQIQREVVNRIWDKDAQDP